MMRPQVDCVGFARGCATALALMMTLAVPASAGPKRPPRTWHLRLSWLQPKLEHELRRHLLRRTRPRTLAPASSPGQKAYDYKLRNSKSGWSL